MVRSKCKVLELSSNELAGALIREAATKELPSLQDGWVFNFGKRLRELKNAKAYVLVTDLEPLMIQGCLIYELKDKAIPYMAYVEIAPWNKGKKRQYDYVAGCLIAFAYKQSLLAESPYDGMLVFDVQEENEKDEARLMAVYSQKYGALRIGETTSMVIEIDQGKKLIKEFLERV
jgi:hypothetical protein